MARAPLTPASVTEAGPVLADEVGLAGLSMGLLAERLGVKTPSLYKHVSGQADLLHRIAVLGADEVADAVRDATQGRSGTEALAAAANAMRTFAREHPGRYDAANSARSTDPEDPFVAASTRLLASLAAVLHGYEIDPAQEIHALRLLRSVLHGFADIEGSGGFQLDTDVDESFAWMVSLVDRGLASLARQTT